MSFLEIALEWRINLNRLALVSLACLAASLSQAVVITQWNFNSIVPDANTATGTTTPSIGIGSAALAGGTTATFASGDANGGSTDPAVGDDSGWNLTTFPAQGTNSGTAGARFNVSTVGYHTVSFVVDVRHSNTSSKFMRIDYSGDNGTTWTLGTTFEATLGGDTWYNGRSISLVGAGDNPNVAVRVVSVFAPGGSTYSASATSSSYSTSGTYRLDMATFNGTPVPEPASLSIIAAGLIPILRRRRKG